MATLSILGATTGARQDQQEEDGTDEAPEPTAASPTPLSLGGTGEEGPVSAKRVADLFRFRLSGTESLAALLGTGQAALREFLLGVQRTGRAWSTAIDPSAPTAVARAPESVAATQRQVRADIADQQAAEVVAQPPFLGPLMQGDPPPPFSPPPPHPSSLHALVLDGLANGSPSSTVNLGEVSGGDSSSVQAVEAALAAAKRHCPRGS
ncbi:hypothetical protein ACSSS7_007390 [Eimeria intestinalis]